MEILFSDKARIIGKQLGQTRIMPLNYGRERFILFYFQITWILDLRIRIFQPDNLQWK